MERLEDRVLLSTIFVDDGWSALGAGVDPDGAGGATAIGTDAFATIQDAVDQAVDGDVIQVHAGTYVENVHINAEDLSLFSVDGRAVTTIQGISGAGALGTVQITGPTNGVHIGQTDHGFTIIGIDNGLPGIENAAVYFQTGPHTNTVVEGNEIVANGDLGLVTEFGSVINGMRIHNNIFSGQTFVGDTPAGEGSSQQFSLANVPRQVVVISGGSGGGNTSNVEFTDNVITAVAGGINADGHEQGNTLVTIDSHGSTITGNTFEGTTNRFSVALRARGEDAVIEDNTFDSSNMGPTTSFLFLDNGPGLSIEPQTLQEVIDNNTFDQTVTVGPDGSVIVLRGDVDVDVRGRNVVLSVDDLSAAHDIDVEFTDTGLVLTGLYGTTIAGDTEVTIDLPRLRTLAGRLGDGVDNVTVHGAGKQVNLNLGGGENSITFDEFQGQAIVRVIKKIGSVEFTAVDSDFSQLSIVGGDFGTDVVNLDDVTVFGRVQANLAGGLNEVHIEDSIFLSNVSLISQGANTLIDVETIENGEGTRFDENVTVQVGANSVINLSAPGDDVVAFGGRVSIKSRQPNSVLNLGEVLFDSNPKFSRVDVNVL